MILNFSKSFSIANKLHNSAKQLHNNNWMSKWHLRHTQRNATTLMRCNTPAVSFQIERWFRKVFVRNIEYTGKKSNKNYPVNLPNYNSFASKSKKHWIEPLNALIQICFKLKWYRNVSIHISKTRCVFYVCFILLFCRIYSLHCTEKCFYSYCYFHSSWSSSLSSSESDSATAERLALQIRQITLINNSFSIVVNLKKKTQTHAIFLDNSSIMLSYFPQWIIPFFLRTIFTEGSVTLFDLASCLELLINK